MSTLRYDENVLEGAAVEALRTAIVASCYANIVQAYVILEFFLTRVTARCFRP